MKIYPPSIVFPAFQQFSGRGSEIYKDAVALMSFFKEKCEQVVEKGVHPKRFVNLPIKM